MDSPFTEHAIKRMSQRGVQRATAQTVVQFGDRRIFVGHGRASVSVSRDLASELAVTGEISPSIVDRLANLFVVVANDNEAVVTVVRSKNRNSARSYLKPHGHEPRSLKRERS